MPASKEDSYLPARRSLQVWPLRNDTYDALREYSGKYLQMTEEEFGGLMVSGIKSCNGLQQ